MSEAPLLAAVTIAASIVGARSCAAQGVVQVDAAVTDILTGIVAPTGRLPFDLPADMESVEAQAEDAPHDFARTLFRTGFGLRFDGTPATPGTDRPPPFTDER